MRRSVLSLAVFLVAPLSMAQSEFLESVKDGKLLFDFRYRYGLIERDDFEKDANASTIRTRLGWETAPYRGLTFLLEFENISVIGNELYNDGANGLNRPREADPADTEINKMQIAYALTDKQRIIAGRQSLRLDNARFIGSDGWRQNGRSMDVLRYEHDETGPFKLTAAWIGNSNEAGGPDHPNPVAADRRLNGYVLHGQSQGWKGIKLSIFAHFFDFSDRPLDSHSNIGFFARGQWPPEGEQGLTYEASYVSQNDFSDGAETIDVDYIETTLGYRSGPWRARLNYEVLGGNGQYGLQTPLALRHGPNGWADIFLNTPANGLNDINAAVSYTSDVWTIEAAYHRFESDHSGNDYGDEWNLRLRKQLTSRLQASFDAADYTADGFGVDTLKAWLYLYFQW